QRRGALSLRYADEAADLRPLQLMQLATPREPARLLAHCDPGELPVAGAVGFHRDVLDGRGLPGLDARHVPVEQLLHHQDLAGPTLEPSQIDRAGAEHDRFRVKGDRPADGYEDAPAQWNVNHDAHDVRDASEVDTRHDVTDSADLVAVGIEDD